MGESCNVAPGEAVKNFVNRKFGVAAPARGVRLFVKYFNDPAWRPIEQVAKEVVGVHGFNGMRLKCVGWEVAKIGGHYEIGVRGHRHGEHMTSFTWFVICAINGSPGISVGRGLG